MFVVRSFSKLNSSTMSFCLDNYRITINILEKFQLSYDQSLKVLNRYIILTNYFINYKSFEKMTNR